MFCQKCGKQIEDNTKLCPYCGGKVINSNTNKIADTVKKATDTAVNMAQTAKNAANEATNGQAEKYMEKAKETAQSFAEDVKQVVKDKDTSNFLTKNKYRNVKIIAVLLVAVFIIGALFNSDSNEQTAIDAVRVRIYQSYPSVEVSNAKVIEKDGHGRYLVLVDVEDSNEHGYAIGAVVINSDDEILTSIYPYRDKSEKKSVISEQKRKINWGE